MLDSNWKIFLHLVSFSTLWFNYSHTHPHTIRSYIHRWPNCPPALTLSQLFYSCMNWIPLCGTDTEQKGKLIFSVHRQWSGPAVASYSIINAHMCFRWYEIFFSHFLHWRALTLKGQWWGGNPEVFTSLRQIKILTNHMLFIVFVFSALDVNLRNIMLEMKKNIWIFSFKEKLKRLWFHKRLANCFMGAMLIIQTSWNTTDKTTPVHFALGQHIPRLAGLECTWFLQIHYAVGWKPGVVNLSASYINRIEKLFFFIL